MEFQYKLVACGGTFGPLHKGHEAFLLFAFSLSEKVIIGLTSDTYVALYKKDSSIPPFAKREEALQDFLKRQNILARTTIVAIDSPFGPMLEDIDMYPVDAIIVTEDSKEGAERINQERQKFNKKPLTIEVMPVVTTAEKLTFAATHIRSGFMDKNGKSILNSAWFSKNLLLPQELRIELQKPIGDLLTNGLEYVKEMDHSKIVTVGDVTTKRFITAGINPKLAVIDFVIERKQTYNSLKDFNFAGSEEVFHTANPAGSITLDAWKMLLAIVEKIHASGRFILEVVGEEDLFVLPLLIVLPFGFFIFYGQPGKGLVMVEVTEKSKKRAANFMNRFVGA